MIDKCRVFTIHVNKRLEAEAGNIKLPDVPMYNMFDFQNEDEEFLNDFNRIVNDDTLPHADDVYHDSQSGKASERGHEAEAGSEIGEGGTDAESDNLIGMIVGRKREPEGPHEQAQVKRRALDSEGNPIGEAHSNPLMDSRMYEVTMGTPRKN